MVILAENLSESYKERNADLDGKKRSVCTTPSVQHILIKYSIYRKHIVILRFGETTENQFSI